MECSFAIIAIRAVPARENTAPFACTECAPMRTLLMDVMIEPIAGRRMYVHGMSAEERTLRSALPVGS